MDPHCFGQWYHIPAVQYPVHPAWHRCALVWPIQSMLLHFWKALCLPGTQVGTSKPWAAALIMHIKGHRLTRRQAPRNIKDLKELFLKKKAMSQTREVLFQVWNAVCRAEASLSAQRMLRAHQKPWEGLLVSLRRHLTEASKGRLWIGHSCCFSPPSRLKSHLRVAEFLRAHPKAPGLAGELLQCRRLLPEPCALISHLQGQHLWGS